MLELVFAVTHHMMPGDFNEQHPGLRYEAESGLTAAVFKNSYGDPSASIGWTWRHDWLFAEAALTVGYDIAPVLPQLRAGVEINNLRLFVIPSADYKGDPSLVFGAETVLFEF